MNVIAPKTFAYAKSQLIYTSMRLLNGSFHPWKGYYHSRPLLASFIHGAIIPIFTPFLTGPCALFMTCQNAFGHPVRCVIITL